VTTWRPARQRYRIFETSFPTTVSHWRAAITLLDCFGFRLYDLVNKTSGERKMKTLLSLIAGAALALALSSTVSAATPEGLSVAQAQMNHHHHWQPKKHHYGKRMRAHWGASCKMSGSC
jgi:hypothetical protein